MIPIDLAPSEFLKNPDSFDSMLWSATIQNWSASSVSPFGVIQGPMGQMGELAVETKVLLNDNGIDWDIFPDDIDECLPATVHINIYMPFQKFIA